MTTAKIRDPFTPEEKDTTLSSPLYEEAYFVWLKEDIIGLNDQEKYSLIHGRSLRGDRAIKLPNQWRDKLLSELQKRIPNIPPIKEPVSGIEYSRKKIYFALRLDTFKNSSELFQDHLLTILAGQMNLLMFGAKSLSNEIYITVDSEYPNGTINYIAYLEFER